MKDELAGLIVKKCIVKNKISFQDYLNCLHNGINIKREQKLFKSVKHIVSTISENKVALSSHDDKRYLIKGSTKILAWGHYSIMGES